MITETLLNSLKSLFSSLGAKTSDNNYAVGLFDKTSGEPKGMMGMSDLASVLGVIKDRGTIYSDYQETVTDDGLYVVTGSNASDVLTDDGILLVSNSGAYRVKIGITYAKIAVKATNNSWNKLGNS